ncbi:MAG: GGDEF domain-containing protein [Cellulomonadaceae bacterium]|nr:GGDEF domain-containing protein [Cellulomonadaceae bacterium]
MSEFGPFDHLSDVAHDLYIDGYADRAVEACLRWLPFARVAQDGWTWRYLMYTQAIALQELGDHDASARTAEALLAELDPDDSLWHAKALSMFAEASTRAGRHGRAMAAIAEADWRAAQVRPGTYGHLSATMAVALALRSIGLFETADERLRSITADSDPRLELFVVEELAQLTAAWAASLQVAGQPVAASSQFAATASRAVRMARLAVAADSPSMLARARVLEAWALHGLGQTGLAVSIARDAGERFEHRAELSETHLLHLVLAAGAAADGASDEARALLRRVVDETAASGRDTWQAIALEQLARFEADQSEPHAAVPVWELLAHAAFARLWSEREGRFMALQDRDHIRRLTEETDRMGRAVLEDPLTSLGNRRRLLAALETASPGPSSVLFIDVDLFKAVNDSFSHEIGDQVLRKVARIIEASCRATDLLTRYGGDEFVVLSPTDLDVATAMAERIRDAVGRHDWQQVAQGLEVTVTIGVGHAPDARRALAGADTALSAAKRAGRNRVLATR